MQRFIFTIVTVVLIYGAFQLTIGTVMSQRIDDFAAELAATPPRLDGKIGPIALRSSDICTLLTDTEGWKGRLSRYAFLAQGKAADELNDHYRFIAVDGCSKYRMNMIVAEPR